MNSRAHRWIWILLPAAFGSGCDDAAKAKSAAETQRASAPLAPGADPTLGATDGQCPDVPTALFAVEGKCGGVVCHGTPSKAPAIYMDFGHSVADLDKRLLDKPGTGPCADHKLIDTANVENSLLIQKLGPTPPCGAPMPFAQQGQLSDVERECIKQWVRNKVGGS